MNEVEESPAQKLHKIRKRCISRDQFFLRFPRKNAMKKLADDFNEWIVGELKDALMTLEILKGLEIQGINNELQHHEDRVKKNPKNLHAESHYSNAKNWSWYKRGSK